jgi:hypothetical protein
VISLRALESNFRGLNEYNYASLLTMNDVMIHKVSWHVLRSGMNRPTIPLASEQVEWTLAKGRSLRVRILLLTVS